MISSDIEVTNCRLSENESELHHATRHSKLFQETNNNEQRDLSRWTEGHTEAKSSPKVARGGNIDDRSVALSCFFQ